MPLLTAPLLLCQVLKVHLLGHRKRIIASLADRPYEEPPQKPPRFSQLRVSSRAGRVYECTSCFSPGSSMTLGVAEHSPRPLPSASRTEERFLSFSEPMPLACIPRWLLVKDHVPCRREVKGASSRLGPHLGHRLSSVHSH